MSAEQISADLRQVPYFKNLPADLIERIAAGSAVRTFTSGEMVFHQGEPARALFVVRKGGVRIYRVSSDGQAQVLHHMRAGQSFGEAAVLSFHRYPVHATAVESPTEIVEIGAQAFLHAFREDPRLSAAMVSSLCIWLHELVERIEELSVPSAATRLARYLLRQPARGNAERLEIELSMAKKELAAHLAIVPETLSRILRRWQDVKIVSSDGRALSILDSRRLTEIAEGSSEATD